jgi:uncharacterized protein (DUF1330 family)
VDGQSSRWARPFGGRFVIHGGLVDVLEGDWAGDLIVIAFPDRNSAHAWYASAPYRAILPLRTGHSQGTAFITEGVPTRHRAADVLGKAKRVACGT